MGAVGVRLLSIDPGTTHSAYVLLDSLENTVLEKGIVNNHVMLEALSKRYWADRCVVEMVASYGMAVGKDVFETVVWIGRFIERWNTNMSVSHPAERLYRKEVKLHLCNSLRANDSNIRQALLDLYPATGGGKTPQVGTKSQPGPLYGFKRDLYAALGVAVTYLEARCASQTSS